MSHVATRSPDVTNDLEVSDRGRVDVEDCKTFRFPERNEIKAVETTDNADHVNPFMSVGGDTVVVRLDLCKLAERSILGAVVSAVKNVLRMIVIHLSIE